MARTALKLKAAQVDANILISSLIHTTTVVQEVNRYLNSGKHIALKVKALEKGSFFCHIELVETTVDVLKNLFTKENLEVATEIIAAVVGLIAIRKHLKGKKPKNVQHTDSKRIEIANQEGIVLIIESATFNIYDQSSLVSDALAQNFEVLENDPAITAFEITDGNENQLIRVERSDFADLAKKSEEIRDDERRTIDAATLHVVRVSFEEGLKWDFYYKGIKISARINDPAFYELIDRGEAFAKGDRLEVELQTNQKFDSSVNTFVNKSYQVNKILRHVSGKDQQKLNFTPED